MNRYRIVCRGVGCYIVQQKGWVFWYNMFCGYADSPRVFKTADEAEQYLRDRLSVWAAHDAVAGVVKEFTA